MSSNLMEQKLFISTNNGIFLKDNQEEIPQLILKKKKSSFFLRRGARGFFGIGYHRNSHSVIVASREKLGTKKREKSATDLKLYAIDVATSQASLLGVVLDLHDVHQIAVKDELVFLTDCGTNRVLVFDLNKKEIVAILHVGDQRIDINHLNSLHVDNEFLYIGYNNRGNTPSEIHKLSLSVVPDNPQIPVQIDLLGESIQLAELQHTHDIEPFQDTFLVSASHEGRVFDVGSKTFLIQDEENYWVRGLALDAESLWVGCSTRVKRSLRGKKVDGKLKKYMKKDDQWVLEKSFELPECGQVHDLLLVDSK